MLPALPEQMNEDTTREAKLNTAQFNRMDEQFSNNNPPQQQQHPGAINSQMLRKSSGSEDPVIDATRQQNVMAEIEKFNLASNEEDEENINEDEEELRDDITTEGDVLLH